jgi:hypothetical protein
MGLHDCLLQQRHDVSGLSAQGITRPQGCGDHGDEEPEVRLLHERKGPFEHQDRLEGVALTQGLEARGPRCHDRAIVVLGRLDYLNLFLGGHPRLSEAPALRQRDDEMTAGEHRGQPWETEVLLAQHAGETCHVRLEALHRPPTVPQAAVDAA